MNEEEEVEIELLETIAEGGEIIKAKSAYITKEEPDEKTKKDLEETKTPIIKDEEIIKEVSQIFGEDLPYLIVSYKDGEKEQVCRVDAEGNLIKCVDKNNKEEIFNKIFK